jgi:hypothetical protein
MNERQKSPEALHTWLIMLKACQSMSRYLLPPLVEQDWETLTFGFSKYCYIKDRCQ